MDTIVLASLARSVLFLTPLPRLLRDDAQLGSPLTSYTRLQEGVHLFQHGFDPYSGGVFRHSPIQLALFSTVFPLSPFFSTLLWSLADALASWCIIKIWRLRSQKIDTRHERLIAVIYLFNPYNLLPTLAFSTSSLDNSLHLLSLYFASSGLVSPALLTLAVLVYSSLPSILLLPPLVILLLSRPTSALANPRASPIERSRALKIASEFTLYTGLLATLSALTANGWSWIPRTWGAVLSLPDLTPNPGLWWYFFTEMFDHYRPFFLVVFSVHLLIYVAPITIKLRHDPLFAIFILQGIIATFKSYPTLSDPGLFTSSFVLFPEILTHLRHPLPSVMLHIHAALLLPLFHHIWLAQGTGNANFFYASTLVFGLGMAGSVIDGLRAGLKAGVGERDQEKWAVVQM